MCPGDKVLDTEELGGEGTFRRQGTECCFPPLPLPSPPFVPCGSRRKHLEPSGSWREPTRLKASGASWGTPRVV